ncbi:hypothetical protein D9757_000440 [Collybiopsis confluens]|uniref:Peroxidase n=1 Tax=Collybiopsis confluens TaxID=2823264 RepID=A0A8H5I202_9AGAR|nr:hypothetical protein D9757_000440 [Collybiopsis confluens]
MARTMLGFRFFSFLILILVVCTALVDGLSTFHWPNTLLSYADFQLYEAARFSSITEQCSPRQSTTVAAQWLRIAYHDMATHNKNDGTGGLDASIQFELERSQNVGVGMAQSLADFATLLVTTPFFGTADLIALGTVFGVASCGGPIIPYRAGRIDATKAGPATVPEPQQDFASHLQSFIRQGFDQTEMISLVACGHTLGGVRQADFPTIVDADTAMADFDTTQTFDNTIVSQYLQNTTDDVLVVGPNKTTRSDLRIFSSDGILLSPTKFNETCANLIERLINTVPQGVTLSEPISEPFNYLVNDPLFSYLNGQFSMTTTLRVLNLNSNSQRVATMFWLDRQGSSCPPAGCSIRASSNQTNLLNSFGHLIPSVTSSQRFFFNATINAATTISRFWFEINENDGSEPVIVDNDGSGYVIAQDDVFVDVQRSEIVTLFQPTGSPVFLTFKKIVLAVRGDPGSIDASMTIWDPLFNSSSPPFLPVITSTNFQLDETNTPQGGFTFLAANVSFTASSVDIVVSGVGSRAALTLENFLVPTNLPTVTIIGS